jgi:hypothetical protein
MVICLGYIEDKYFADLTPKQQQMVGQQQGSPFRAFYLNRKLSDSL